MPTKQRLRRHDPYPYEFSRQHPRQRGKNEAILRLQPRTTDLPAQHRHLVAKNEKFDVLRRLATPAGHDESEQHPEGRIQSTEQHQMILPDPKKHGRAEAFEPHTRYPAIVNLWRAAWEEFIVFLDYDVEIRKIICSTNAIESLNARYRRAVRARGHFPTDQAALKCLYLVTRSLDPTGRGRARWTMRWKSALNAFAITFAERLTPSTTN